MAACVRATLREKKTASFLTHSCSRLTSRTRMYRVGEGSMLLGHKHSGCALCEFMRVLSLRGAVGINVINCVPVWHWQGANPS